MSWFQKTIILLTLLLVSCESIRYYGQAIHGQLAIVGRRQSIQSLVDNPGTAPELKARLENIFDIRQFADSALSLPVGKNYSTYVDLGRPFAVWNVFTTPEFSMTLNDWCYPVAGCVTYRGYFSADAARKFAKKQEEKGDDVYLGGVAAYSTLGWFSDSVLNTVVNREDYELASLIFHELAHQVVYIPGDTEFNESFATAVELEGLRRWLLESDYANEENDVVARAVRERSYRREFVSLARSVIPALEKIYRSGRSVADMRREKARVFDRLRQDYLEVKSNWNGYSAYDAWFASEINNAKLSTVATYFNKVPAFDALLAEVEFDLPAFYGRVKQLAALAKPERDVALAALVSEAS